MSSYTVAYEKELRMLLSERVTNAEEALLVGNGAPDYAAYQRLLGRLHGLREAVDCLAAAHEEVEAKQRA